MSLPRSLPRLAVALALALSIPASEAFAGGDIIPPRQLGRKFPQQQFCALPVSLSFTPPTSAVVVFFDAQNYVDNGGTLLWTNQSIDNVTVATTAQVSANTEGPPEFSSGESCYERPKNEPPVSYFHFNRAGLTLDLLELFDTNPGPRGWDLSNGGFYIDSSYPNPPISAPRDVENYQDPSGGSLGLGQESASPSLSDVATSSIEVSALTPGTSYDLGAWWNANGVSFPHDDLYLTIRIETPGGTPIARTSWGALKRGYR